MLTTEPDPAPRITVDPLATRRNAAEAFLLALALKESIETIFTQPEPLSVDVLLGPIWATIWAVTLFVGSVLALAGMAWPGRSLTAASIQQIGYASFAPAALARGIALIAVGRTDEAITIIAFAAISLVRLAQIESRVGRIYPSGVAGLLRRWVHRG